MLFPKVITSLLLAAAFARAFPSPVQSQPKILVRQESDGLQDIVRYIHPDNALLLMKHSGHVGRTLNFCPW